MKNAFKDLHAITVFALASALFFLSISPVAATVSLVIAIIAWVANKNYKDSFTSFRENKTWWIFISFYLLHIVSLLWTSNFKYAFFDLQVKLGYLICPLVIAGFILSPAERKTIQRGLILGTSLASVICILHAVWQYMIHGEIEYFFYGKFSVLMHPSYFMIYLNMSMIFIFYHLYWDRDNKRGWRNLLVALLFLQLFVLFLLSGRTALAVFMLSMIILFVVMARKKLLVMKDGKLIFTFIGFAILFQFGIFSFFNRYGQISSLVNEPDTKEENSASIRYNLWRIAGDLVSEHPVAGVGIGDIKEELVKKYEQYHYEYGIRNRISPHNQYLHTAVILGILGVIGLLGLLSAAFVLAWRNGDWPYILFIIIIFLNCMTESLLERQAGVLFFTIMNSLFASQYIGPKKFLS